MSNNDFTLAEYQSILVRLKADYEFTSFDKAASSNAPSVIWRHDVDASVVNAQKLATIEATLGIRATYFFMLGNWFYDIRDRETHQLIREIQRQGHSIALHYDFDYLPSGSVTNMDSFIRSLQHQKNEIEQILEVEINVFSLHNPTVIDAGLFKVIQANSKCLEMINVYGPDIQNKFKYCSDSNGMWRFDSLHDLIDSQKYPYLQILTHPEWWTEKPMSPRQRIEKVAMDRAASTLQRYDDFLFKHGRPNQL